MTELYRRHLEALDRWLSDSLERARRAGVEVDGVLFHSGRAAAYYADDQEIVFWPTPHFRRWVPMEGPEHVVLARPGRRPAVVRVRSRDYWYDSSAPPISFWEERVELQEVERVDQIGDALGALDRVAYVGSAPVAAPELGIPEALVEPPALLAPLDWYRAYKTEYEIELIRVAAEKSAGGHAAAGEAFGAGGSEREIHWAYLRGSDQVGPEVPFGTIIALDEKAAVLHYERKRGSEAAPGKACIVDAGASWMGYASDITRTWIRDDVDPVFRALVEGVDAVERELVAMVTPGRAFQEIHFEAHRRLAVLLAEVGVITGSVDEALERGLMQAFMPHGLGHHLGIQVHDIGGRQLGPEGGTVEPPEGHPWLRTTRPLEPGQVVTIEPGLYFVELLLEPLRVGPAAEIVDWGLVDRMAPCGGIRIEDDVLCTAAGPEDLSRPLIPGPRGE